MSEREAQRPYQFLVPGPSQDYSPYPPWYPKEVYYDSIRDIISCMLTKLNGDSPTLAYPGAWETTYPALVSVGATGAIVIGQITFVPPEKYYKLIMEHLDLYFQCSCELFPEDRAFCKKEGDNK